MSSYGAAARAAFLLDPAIRFLNNGSFGAAPRPVIAATEGWRDAMEKNPDRFMREVLPGELRRSAGALARFVGAEQHELAFVENATAGVNAVLRSLHFGPGDEILTTDHRYGAVHQALRHSCGQWGARLVEAVIPLPLRRTQDLVDSISARITPSTRLLLIDHIASPTGIVFPVAQLAALAHKRGISVLVDGAHAPGQIPLQIPALGVDWYVGNCHKWLFTPRGCGFLWAKPSAQAGLHPLSISHDYGESFTAEFDWVGTRDSSAWLSVPAALAYLEEIGADGARAYCHGLVAQAAERLAAAWATDCDADAALHASMMAVRLPPRLCPSGLPLRTAAARVMSAFLANGIVVAVNGHSNALWLRLSAQIYNMADDYDCLLDGRIEQAVRVRI